MKITIDGPSGAGKSSIAKRIANKLNIIYIDTGAMYRAVGYYCIINNIDTKDSDRVIKILDEVDIDIVYVDGEQNVILNGKNVSNVIRTQEVSMAASNVSAINEVRVKLIELQRKLANNRDVIMDGRDAGTGVLPDAEVKIFLTASSEKRAERRYLELIEKGESAELSTVLDEINLRDKNDMERKISPLKIAKDAVYLDTTDLDFEQSVEAVIKIIGDKNV